MKIKILERFDYPLATGQVVCCTPQPEPITVKREIGEYGVSIGKAEEVGVKKAKTATPKPAKRQDNADIGPVGGTDSGPDDGREAATGGGDSLDGDHDGSADSGTVFLEG